MSSGKQEDYISLVDIVRIFVRRKKLFIFLLIIFIILFVPKVFVVTPSYTYLQQIYIDSYISRGQLKTVVPINDVTENIKAYALPKFIQSYNQKNPNHLISLKSLQYKFIISSGGNILTLTMVAPKSAFDEQLFSHLNTFVYTQIMELGAPYVNSFKSNAQNNLMILKEEIPALTQLRRQESSLKNVRSTGTANDLQSLRDIYIASLGSRTQYDELYNLKKMLEDAQESLSTLKQTSINQIAMIPQPESLILVTRLLLAVCAALIITILLVFLVNLVANITKEL